MPSLLDNVFIVPLVITYLLLIALSFRFLKRLKAGRIRHPKESTRDGFTLPNRKPLPAVSVLLLTYWWVIGFSAIFYCSIWKVKCLISNVWLLWSVSRQYKTVAREGDLAFLLRILSSHFSLSNAYWNNVTKGMYWKYSNIALSTLMGEGWSFPWERSRVPRREQLAMGRKFDWHLPWWRLMGLESEALGSHGMLLLMLVSHS